MTQDIDASTTAADLRFTFGEEWEALSPSDRALIVRDCSEDGGISSYAEYRRNIGTGNLSAYARVMRARFNGADRS